MSDELVVCPICGLPPTRSARDGEEHCIIHGGDRCYQRGFARLQEELRDAQRGFVGQAVAGRYEGGKICLTIELHEVAGLPGVGAMVRIRREQGGSGG